MIWFTCKQCGKIQSRAETSAGVMVFCTCGAGTLVPWESTISPPAADTAESPSPPLRSREPTAAEHEQPTKSEVGKNKRRRRFTPDPNLCLNHDTIRSQKICNDCGEAFCNDCVVSFQGMVVCAPCKNFRVCSLQRPPSLSMLALGSVLLAVGSGPLAICLVGGSGNLLWTLIAVAVQLVALGMGATALRKTEISSRLSGRSLALTGILTAAISTSLSLALAAFGVRLWS